MNFITIITAIRCGKYDCWRNCCSDPEFLTKLDTIAGLEPALRRAFISELCGTCPIEGQPPPVGTPPGGTPPGGTPPGGGAGQQPAPSGTTLERLREVACSSAMQTVYTYVITVIDVVVASVSPEWQARLRAVKKFVEGIQLFCSSTEPSIASVDALCAGYREIKAMQEQAITVPALGLFVEALRRLFGQGLGPVLEDLCRSGGQ